MRPIIEGDQKLTCIAPRVNRASCPSQGKRKVPPVHREDENRFLATDALSRGRGLWSRWPGGQKEVLAANPANSANGCRRFDRLDLVVASPYATLRVYRKAAPSGRSSLLSAWASELAPRRATRSHAYGSVCVRRSRRAILLLETMEKATPLQLEPQDRGRGRGRVPGLPGKEAHSGGRPWDAVPRHGEAVDQAAELRVWPTPRTPRSVRGVSGVRGKNQERFPASRSHDCIGLSACAIVSSGGWSY